MSVIFGLENRQGIFSLQVSNWRVLMKLGTTSVVILHGTNHLQQRTLKWVCAKRTMYFNKKKSVWVQRLCSEQSDERRVLWTIFLNICKNNVRLLGSVVAEDSKLLVQQQTSATSTTLFWARKALPDASYIATDCQKNRYPSFISCP